MGNSKTQVFPHENGVTELDGVVVETPPEQEDELAKVCPDCLTEQAIKRAANQTICGDERIKHLDVQLNTIATAEGVVRHQIDTKQRVEPAD